MEMFWSIETKDSPGFVDASKFYRSFYLFNLIPVSRIVPDFTKSTLWLMFLPF